MTSTKELSQHPSINYATSNGAILTFWRPARLTTTVRFKETLFIQELQPALNANISSEKLYYFIKKPFHCVPLQTVSVYSVRLKRLKYLLQMFSV